MYFKIMYFATTLNQRLINPIQSLAWDSVNLCTTMQQAMLLENVVLNFTILNITDDLSNKFYRFM